MKDIELKDKYALTVPEASRYFGVSDKKLRMLAAEHSETDDFAFMKGCHYMIIREKFQEFLLASSSI